MMNNFYWFIKTLNETQEYLDELNIRIENEGGRLIYNLNKSFSDEYKMPSLILLYQEAKGKSEEEFLKSPFININYMNTPWKKELHSQIYNAAKNDLNTYLKTLYHEAIDAEKNGRNNFYIDHFLLTALNSFNRKNIDEKVVKKIAENFRKYFSVDDLINYITAYLPENLGKIDEDNKEKLLIDLDRKIDSAASNYLKDLLQGVIEAGVDNE